MLIKVALFAAAKEIVGDSVLEIELSEEGGLGDLKQAMVRAVPALEPLVAKSAFSIDHQYASDDDLVTEHSEVAIIPPVSGG